MAHFGWCGKPCAECLNHCNLDEIIPCSPDCHNLLPNGERLVRKCQEEDCDAWPESVDYDDLINDLSFAVAILEERLKMLDYDAAFARKLKCAIPATFPPTYSLYSLSEQIYRFMERWYTVEDIKIQLDREEIDKCGLSSGQILGDEEIIAHILHLYHKCETGQWENMEFAVEQGIADVVNSRKKEV